MNDLQAIFKQFSTRTGLQKKADGENVDDGKTIQNVSSPDAAMATQVAADKAKALDGVPGEASSALETTPDQSAQGPGFVEAPPAQINENTPEVTELENQADLIQKEASAVIGKLKMRAAQSAMQSVRTTTIEKHASAPAPEMDPQALAYAFHDWALNDDQAFTSIIQKRADAGDPIANTFIDIMGAYEQGLQKKAEDMQAMSEANPEAAPEEVEEALNAGADEEPVQALPDDAVAEQLAAMIAEQAEAAGADPEELLELLPIVAETSDAMVQQLVESGTPPEEAVAAVADAAQSVQDIGGAQGGSPEEKQAVVDNLEKTAAAFPARDILVDYLYETLSKVHNSRGGRG